jgi:hypothetical protein
MASCHEMKTGEIYICEDCGIEVQVTRECSEDDSSCHACGCHSERESCTLTCCGKEMMRV